MKNSIFKNVLWSMGTVMLVAILTVEICSLFLIHKDGQRAQELFEDTIDSYRVFWENKLNETSKMMLSFVSMESGELYGQLCSSEDKLTVETVKLQLRSQIAKMNARSGYELTTFVCVPDRDIYFAADEKDTPYLHKQAIKERVKQYIAEQKISSGDKWNVVYVEEIPYLLKIYHMDNGYIGSLFAVEHIMGGLYNRNENWGLEMVDAAGNTVMQKGTIHKGMTVSYNSVLEYTNTRILVTIGSGRLYSNMGTGILILAGAMLFAVLLISAAFMRQHKNVFSPLERLRAAMEAYSKGDMDVRLDVVQDGSQIDNLYQTFNDMADQVKHLKIQVYETELKRQRVNSNYLRIQIQPHFYTNILNLIYGMAQMKDFASIQKLTLACGSYFRYLLGQKGMFVPLQEELKCLDSYVEIQRYRYQDRFTAQISVEPGLEEQLILPLLIQTFFGNSLKHNVMRVPLLKVEVTVRAVGSDRMQIVIADNGNGFPKEVLEKLENNESVEKDGEHIGIQNVKERIRALYGQAANMQIESGPGNTVVTLLLPLVITRGDSENEITAGR